LVLLHALLKEKTKEKKWQRGEEVAKRRRSDKEEKK